MTDTKPMKNVRPLIILLLVAFGCSTQHYIQKAQFDTAVIKATEKIRKDWDNQDEIDNLKYAFSKANQIDKDRLAYLFESGEDNIWDEVHQKYSALHRRQEIVKTLPNDVLTQIGYSPENYAKKITESKQNAAEFYYQKGVSLLKMEDKYQAREAYGYFLKAKRFYPNYKDVDRQISDAKYVGTNHILFRMENHSKVALPEDFETELLKISLKSLNQTWIDYDTRENKNVYYDYYIQLSLKNIAVSPENTLHSEHVEEKEIEDGFKYLLDANGNVSKDTLGNDVKLPVYKIITCKIVETSQYKEAIVTGTVDYINTADGQLIKTHPVVATMVFDHHSAEAFGDLNALKPESRKKAGIAPLPYPPDPLMIMDAASILKENTKQIIYDNKSWLKN